MPRKKEAQIEEMSRHMVLMTERDKKRWTEIAKGEGLTLGAWIRKICVLASGGKIATGNVRANSIKGVYE